MPVVRLALVLQPLSLGKIEPPEPTAVAGCQPSVAFALLCQRSLQGTLYTFEGGGVWRARTTSAAYSPPHGHIRPPHWSSSPHPQCGASTIIQFHITYSAHSTPRARKTHDAPPPSCHELPRRAPSCAAKSAVTSTTHLARISAALGGPRTANPWFTPG